MVSGMAERRAATFAKLEKSAQFKAFVARHEKQKHEPGRKLLRA
jgi:hypothetical protein